MMLLNTKLLKDAFLNVLEPVKFLPKQMKMKGYWAEDKKKMMSRR